MVTVEKPILWQKVWELARKFPDNCPILAKHEII